MATWIRGVSAPHRDTVEAAARLLTEARAPVIAGIVCDVDAVRAALRLAAAVGASFDPLAAPALYADLAALSSRGMVATTPAEALARADLVLAVGEAAAAPLVRRLRESLARMGRTAGTRTVHQLGIGDEGLLARIGLLRAMTAGRMGPSGELGWLAAALRSARFAVLVYEPADLGDLGVEMLQGLAAELNESGRAFTLSLADPWQGRAVLQMTAWTTALGPRLGFARGRPEHDPWRFDAARQAAAGESDAMLWLAALPAPRSDWSRALPCVALVAEGEPASGEVVIEVAWPGDTAPGTLFDEARAALVFRPAARSGDRPSAAEVLDSITAALAAKAA